MSRRAVAVILVMLVVVALVAWWLSSDAPNDTREGLLDTDNHVAADDPARVRRDDVAEDRLHHDVPSAARELADAGAIASSIDAGSRDDDGGSHAADAKWVTDFLTHNAEAAEKTIDAFCAESKKMKRPLPKLPDAPKRDASSFLTVRIDWEGPMHTRGLLHLPEPLRDRIKAYGNDWPKLMRAEDLLGLDFSWMTQLHQYDFWNVLAEGPLRESRSNDFYDAPIPNFIELVYWTKLRFAKALRDGSFAEASNDLHQLVALLRTTGILIADMIAINLLNLERAALEAAGASVDLGYTADDTARQRQLGRSAMYFFYPGVSAKTMKRALECGAAWECASLAEGLGAHVTISQFSTGPDTRAQLDALVDASHCNPEMMRWIRAAPQRAPDKAHEVYDGVQPLESYFPAAPR